MIAQKLAPVPVPSYPVEYCGCGLSFESPKYRGEIEWGHCPCEKCDRFLSKEEADKIIRSSINSEREVTD